MIKKILSILLLIINMSFAGVPEPDQDAPDPNYGIMMPTSDEQDPSISMIGDDNLNQEKIEYGFGYQSDVGVSYLEKKIDEKGNFYYLDTRTDEKIYSFKERELSQDYKDGITGIQGDHPITPELKDEKYIAIKNAKELRKSELLEKEYTPKQYENTFLHQFDASARGNSIVNSLFLNPENLEDDIEKKETQLYIDNFSYSQSKNSVETFKSQDNTSKLVSGYQLVDELKANLSAKYSNKSIQCYISRNLIPKYFCPLIGKENTLYAGDLKTSSGTGMTKCNENCKESKSCVEYSVLNSLEIDLVPENTVLNLYPSFIENSSFIESNTIDNLMLVDTASFDIEIKPSSSWEGTAEEFELFLQENNIKVRFSIIKKDNTLNNPPELLIDAELLTLKSALTKKELYISNNMENLVFLFYKPYFTQDVAKEVLLAPKIFEKIESIEIKNIKGKYKSKNLYFCQFRQSVNSTSECKGEGGEMITLLSGSQVINICTDSDHKIGPDRKYGGFYTEETCELNCIESKDCLPTYKHYSDFNTEELFQASVGCVDSEDNSACTQEKCEELLADNNLNPLNEWVTYNDDLKKQTIMNNVLDTTITRPKFNLGDELTVSTSYSELFQSEMKDAAYKYMLDNATYNRILYRVGEESPRKMSYFSDFVSSKEQLFWNLKPSSFDIDNNEMYNLYVILELDQLYSPIAGVFMIDGQQMQANADESESIQFIDKTYMIRTSANENWWKVFKKIEFTQMKQMFDEKRCADGSSEVNSVGYFDNQIIPEDCAVSLKIIWPETPNLNRNRNVFYNSETDVFETYDIQTELAEKYLSQEFSSDVVENTYMISNFLQLDLEQTPGGLIRNQESLNNDMNFRKIYNVDFQGTKVRGWPFNYKVYAFYSKENLTYKDILDSYLIEENIIYDKININKYPKKIKHDGEMNNNIKPFILGDKNITTVNIEMEPFVQEEGQKVFKFMFLYDDIDGTNPFSGYEIQGN